MGEQKESELELVLMDWAWFEVTVQTGKKALQMQVANLSLKLSSLRD